MAVLAVMVLAVMEHCSRPSIGDGILPAGILPGGISTDMPAEVPVAAPSAEELQGTTLPSAEENTPLSDEDRIINMMGIDTIPIE